MVRGPRVSDADKATRTRLRDDPVRQAEMRAAEAIRVADGLRADLIKANQYVTSAGTVERELRRQLRSAQLRAQIYAIALEQSSGTPLPLESRAAKRTREADIIRNLMQARLCYEDMADVCALVLRFAGPGRTSLLDDLEHSPSFQPCLKQLNETRDRDVAHHLATRVYPATKWEMLRLAIPLSWRDMGGLGVGLLRYVQQL